MADYLTRLSFMIPTGEKDTAEFFEFIEALEWACDSQFEIEEGDDVNIASPDGWPDPIETMKYFDFNIGFDASLDTSGPAPKIWMCDAGGVPNLDLLVRVVELAVEKFDIQEPVVFEWANTCSRPRLDGFGGGIAVIARDADGNVQSRTRSTVHLGQEMVAEINADCMPSEPYFGN